MLEDELANPFFHWQQMDAANNSWVRAICARFNKTPNELRTMRVSDFYICKEILLDERKEQNNQLKKLKK